MTRSRTTLAIIAIVAAATSSGVYVCLQRAPTKLAPASSSAFGWPGFPPGYDAKVRKFYTYLQDAPTSRPTASDTAEFLEEAQRDSDYRVRVRAIMMMPRISDREKAIDVLITCVHDRESASSGGGNVPLYATTYLANISATRAIPDVEDWIAYLQRTPPPYDATIRAMILKKGREDLARLKGAAASQPSS